MRSSQKQTDVVAKLDEVQKKERPWLPLDQEAMHLLSDYDGIICATAAMNIYRGEETLNRKMKGLLDEKGYEVCHESFVDGKLDPGHDKEAHPPMSSIIFRTRGGGESSTMLITFRGSRTLNDWAANADATPIKSRFWSEDWPNVKVHKGWDGEIWNYFGSFTGVTENMNGTGQLRSEMPVLELLKSFNVTKILFTGHSMGGALAQIASLAAKVKLPVALSEDHKRSFSFFAKKTHIPEVRTFTFAAPMPVYFEMSNLNEKEKLEVVQESQQCSFNFVFEMDVVPHLPGHHEWIEKSSGDLKSLLGTVVKNKLPSAIPWSLVQPYIEPYIHSISKVPSRQARLFQKYKHVAKIIHFDLNDAAELAAFTSFKVQVLTPEQYERLDYPFPEKDECFKELLGGVHAHRCLPRTIVYPRFCDEPKCGRLTYVNGGGCCARKMVVSFTNLEGSRIKKKSSKSHIIMLPLGATDIKARFKVIGGGKVNKVDRCSTRQPWVLPAKEEEIEIANGDSIDVVFEMKGTSFHSFVHKAWDFGRTSGPRSDWEWCGGKDGQEDLFCLANALWKADADGSVQ